MHKPTTEEFRATGERIWGDGWITKLADFFDLNPRTASRMAAGKVPVPDDIWSRMVGMAWVEPPPESPEARPMAAEDTIWPKLDRILQEAELVGWSPQEVKAAVRSWVLGS